MVIPFVVPFVFAAHWLGGGRSRPKLDAQALAREMREHPPARRGVSAARLKPEKLNSQRELACIVLAVVGLAACVYACLQEAYRGMVLFLVAPSLVAVAVLIAVLTDRWSRRRLEPRARRE